MISFAMFTRDRESRTRTNSMIVHDIPILSTFVMVNFISIRKINVIALGVSSSLIKYPIDSFFFPLGAIRVEQVANLSRAIFHVSPSRSPFASINYRGNIRLGTFTNRNFSTRPIDARQRKINITKIVTRKNQCRQKRTNNPEQTHE